MRIKTPQEKKNMKVKKKFKATTTLKDFVEEIKKDGCKEITQIIPLGEDYEVSFNADGPNGSGDDDGN